ncbi:MAG: hypothetical protein ABDH28_07805 [Brevinematia bacterium]
MKKKVVLTALVLGFWSLEVFAWVNFSTFDPTRNWRKIETKYFCIYFSETSEKTASKLATVCDEVYEILSKEANVRFSYKFPVIVANQSDLPNGYYAPIPTPRIVIYTSPISGFYIDMDFDDDIKSVFAHELIHALTLEEANGFWHVLRAVFGYYVTPNLYLPGMFIESITVMGESMWGYGRLNNPIFRDTFYSQVYYGKFRGLYNASLVNEFPLDTWYLYGGMFFYYLVQKYGYEKAFRFYKESSHYFPGFFCYSFNNNFGSDIFLEWEKFEIFSISNILTRSYSNTVERVTFDGAYKGRLRLGGDFLVYSQSGRKGELSSLKFFDLRNNKSGFLIYGRYIPCFDLKGNTIAFVETISSKYYTRNILKVGKLAYGEYLRLIEERNLGIEGVYDVAVLDENTLLALVESDSETKVVKITISDSVKVETLLEEGIFYKRIYASDNLISLVSRKKGRDTIRVFLTSPFRLIKEIDDFELILDASIAGRGIVFSGKDGEKIDVFEYDLERETMEKVVSAMFSFISPVVYSGRIYGISFSYDGFDVFYTTPLSQEFKKLEISKVLKVNESLGRIQSTLTNISESTPYGHFNNITPLSILMSFLPDIQFNSDLSLRKLGVFFSFYDEPLEFRNFLISLGWNFNSKTIDYEFAFTEAGIPYVLIGVRVLREHLDSGYFLVDRLVSLGYNYSMFTLDYFRLRVDAEIGNNYVGFHPFFAVSLPSFVGRREVGNAFPDYKFYTSDSSLFSPYLTIGSTLSTLENSLGAIAMEEGFLYNVNLKVANRFIGSREDSVLLSQFFSYSVRLWGNSVAMFGIGMKNTLFSTLENTFSYSGYKYVELFPIEEGDVFEFYLPTYFEYPTEANNSLVGTTKLYLKLFEANGGIWPFYVTSIWCEVGARAGLLFNTLQDVVYTKVATELVGGVFFSLNLIGRLDSKNGIEVTYNADSRTLYLSLLILFPIGW